MKQSLAPLGLIGAVLGGSLLLLEATLRVLAVRRPRNDAHWTWGYPVSLNNLGFREREQIVPKPAGGFRIMVRGDSLTWDVGLPVD